MGAATRETGPMMWDMEEDTKSTRIKTPTRANFARAKYTDMAFTDGPMEKNMTASGIKARDKAKECGRELLLVTYM